VETPFSRLDAVDTTGALQEWARQARMYRKRKEHRFTGSSPAGLLSKDTAERRREGGCSRERLREVAGVQLEIFGKRAKCGETDGEQTHRQHVPCRSTAC
jgi:hypothetical protein